MAASSSQSQTQYPPVNQNQLPQWTRVGHLDKSRYPKPFSKDSLNHQLLSSNRSSDDEEEHSDMYEGQNPALRVQYLERSIAFLRAQHQEVLTSLHSEVESLRAQNKELHFRSVMAQKENGIIPENDEDYQQDTVENYIKEISIRASDSGDDGSHLQLKDQQIIELKHQIRDLKSKNNYLTQLVDSLKSQAKSSDSKGRSSARSKQRQIQSSDSGSDISINLDTLKIGPIPRGVVVYSRQGSSTRRKPSEGEMEKIISHLYKVNEQQEHELARLKFDLKEVLYSKKWTPDAYLLARAYVAEDVNPGDNLLPQLRSTTRKLPEIAHINRDTVTLPALKNTMGTKAAERRKRTQILQRARLHKEIS